MTNIDRRTALKMGISALLGAGVAAFGPKVMEKLSPEELSPINKAITIEPTTGRTDDQFYNEHPSKDGWQMQEGSDIRVQLYENGHYILELGLFQTKSNDRVLQVTLQDYPKSRFSLQKEIGVIRKVLPNGAARVRFSEKNLPEEMQPTNRPLQVWDIEYFCGGTQDKKYYFTNKSVIEDSK